LDTCKCCIPLRTSWFFIPIKLFIYSFKSNAASELQNNDTRWMVFITQKPPPVPCRLCNYRRDCLSDTCEPAVITAANIVNITYTVTYRGARAYPLLSYRTTTRALKFKHELSPTAACCCHEFISINFSMRSTTKKGGNTHVSLMHR